MTTARRQPGKASTSKDSTSKASTSKASTSKASTSKASTSKAGTKPTPAIVLTGPPGLLRATVSVENAVEQRVVVRGLTLYRTGQQAVTGSGGAVIAPGATAQVPVSFRLEPHTPPGEYAAEVEVGGLRRAALLRVEPDLAMHVSPRRVLAGIGRSPVTLTVAHDGNLAIALAAVVRAPTDDGGPDPGPDVTLTLSSATTLTPGTTTVLECHVTVPADLDPARRHTARIPVGTADLDVIILPRDPSE